MKLIWLTLGSLGSPWAQVGLTLGSLKLSPENELGSFWPRTGLRFDEQVSG